MGNAVADAKGAVHHIGRDDEEAGSGDLITANIARLKTLFPQIVTDGRVDFDVLRQLLGDAVEEGEERYGLDWKGKRRARAFALTPSLGTLRPVPKDSVQWEDTRNILVEGDNLEVLKLLRRSYAGKVKLIYIDPPYNTGHDFVYPDNYQDSIGNYLSLTGQKGDEGEALTSNKDASGRFHTDWLNMIYPRLMAAKELLRDDGFLCASCDDSEITALIRVIGEIFGEDQHLGTLIWKSRVSEDTRATTGISIDHEYIVVASKNAGNRIRGVEKDTNKFNNPDNDARGPWRSADLTGLATVDQRPNLHYPIIDPITGRCFPPPAKGWRYERKTMENKIQEGRILFPLSEDGRPRHKLFLKEIHSQFKNMSSVITEYNTGMGTKEVNKFIGEGIFHFPKPIGLIRQIINQISDNNDLILDFFAGSGTTGHAVMAQNAEDGGNRRFILVQLPEPLTPDNRDQKTASDFLDSIHKPRTISELTKERLRRAGAKIRKDHPDADMDTGFRVYTLATSNLKPWQPDTDDLQASLLDAVDNILPDRSEEDLLVELLLKTGGDLILPREQCIIGGRAVHALDGGRLMVCLADISADSVEAIAQGMADWVQHLAPTQTIFYFRDTGLGAEGTRAATKANLSAILRQRLGDRITKIASI